MLGPWDSRCQMLGTRLSGRRQCLYTLGICRHSSRYVIDTARLLPGSLIVSVRLALGQWNEMLLRKVAFSSRKPSERSPATHAILAVVDRMPVSETFWDSTAKTTSDKVYGHLPSTLAAGAFQGWALCGAMSLGSHRDTPHIRAQ